MLDKNNNIVKIQYNFFNQIPNVKHVNYFQFLIILKNHNMKIFGTKLIQAFMFISLGTVFQKQNYFVKGQDIQIPRFLVHIIKLFYQIIWIHFYSTLVFLILIEYFQYLKKEIIAKKSKEKVVASYVNLHCSMFNEVEHFYFNNQNLFFTLEERGKDFDAR